MSESVFCLGKIASDVSAPESEVSRGDIKPITVTLDSKANLSALQKRFLDCCPSLFKALEGNKPLPRDASVMICEILLAMDAEQRNAICKSAGLNYSS